ncbi:hypothetical protein D9M68_671950 [compost metagenome]
MLLDHHPGHCGRQVGLAVADHAQQHQAAADGHVLRETLGVGAAGVQRHLLPLVRGAVVLEGLGLEPGRDQRLAQQPFQPRRDGLALLLGALFRLLDGLAGAGALRAASELAVAKPAGDEMAVSFAARRLGTDDAGRLSQARQAFAQRVRA